MSIVGNRHLCIIFCGMFLASNAIHDFWQDSPILAFSTNMLPTVKFEVSESVVDHTPPALLSHGKTFTPSEELKKAGQELQLGLTGDFLGPKVNDPRQTHTTDTTYPQSGFGCIHTNSNFQIPLEVSLKKTLALQPPFENCIINQQLNNPKRKIDMLVQFHPLKGKLD
ncbi:hypothetical protein PGTUg99_016211 [Puccinia graminis f. sp. tritici]|uniref:Uncharacterized protein n=1 Tax=Puccinia graminis f. sp. tritici TaxID=56615 RepID=A0A5B0NDT8_PUCGR|nr:hypothetical protein PGTUg99_016211 [Puccinia graminis f. sp. tritici]